MTATIDVPRRSVFVEDGKMNAIRFPDLATRVSEEWKARGSHRDASDMKLDQAVLHAEDKMVFAEIAAVIDALYTPKRGFGGVTRQVPAFNVSFAVN